MLFNLFSPLCHIILNIKSSIEAHLGTGFGARLMVGLRNLEGPFQLFLQFHDFGLALRILGLETGVAPLHTRN